jgi:hypothetical protein
MNFKPISLMYCHDISFYPSGIVLSERLTLLISFSPLVPLFYKKKKQKGENI